MILQDITAPSGISACESDSGRPQKSRTAGNKGSPPLPPRASLGRGIVVDQEFNIASSELLHVPSLRLRQALGWDKEVVKGMSRSYHNDLQEKELVI